MPAKPRSRVRLHGVRNSLHRLARASGSTTVAARTVKARAVNTQAINVTAPTPKPAPPAVLARGFRPLATMTATAIRPTAHILATTPVKAKLLPHLAHIRPLLAVDMFRATPGKKRSDLEVPVAPKTQLTDTLLFEDPDTPSQKFYLPRYDLKEEDIASAGGMVRRHVLKLTTPAGDQPGKLEVGLVPTAPPGIDVAETGAQPLEHKITVALEFSRPIGQSGKAPDKLEFTSYLDAAEGNFRVILELPRLADTDLVAMVLTTAEFEPRLVITRSLRLGVPLAKTPARGRSRNKKLYSERNVRLSCEVEPRPFLFRSDHPAFAGLNPPQGQPGLIRHLVHYEQKAHSYYQDQLQPDVFFYLPESLGIARDPEPPHAPSLKVRFESEGTGLDNVQAVIEMAAVPVTNHERIEAAEPVLAELCPGLIPRFAPLTAGSDLRFRLGLPGNNAFQDRPEARVDLVEGIVDGFTIPLDDFQVLFDAIFGASSILLQGEVIVDLGDMLQERVLFSGCLDDFTGEPLESFENPQGDTGAVRAILRNVIESPVQINSLTAMIARGDREVEATIDGLDLSQPLKLEPQASTEFTVRPVEVLEGTAPPDALFDLSGVEVLPDPAALWLAIVDQTTPAKYKQSITVRALENVFTGAENPDDTIGAVTVEFEGGNTVELNSEQLTVTAELFLPIADVVLRQVDAGQYRYRLRIIRSGGQTIDEQWRTDTSQILFPDLR